MDNSGVVLQNEMMKEELSGGMPSVAHWTTMFSFFRCVSLFTEKKKMERFVTAKDGDVQHFTDAASAKNTKTSTNTWLNAWNAWADARGFGGKKIFEYDPVELDKILSKFYVELRKKDGGEYEPSCLNVMITALDRHLKENDYTLSIVRDREFAKSKKVLEGIATELRRKGMGKQPNRSRSMSIPEVEVLWQHGELGKHSPRALIHTVFWFLRQHCGIRGKSEHYNLKVDDFVIENDSEGRENVTFYEGITKNHTGGLNWKPRKVKARMYAVEGDRNPVDIFKSYIAKRPLPFRNTGPLYLEPIDRPKSEVWYKVTRMGINKVGKLTQGMVSRTPLKDVPKKFTGHSLRSTSVSRMKKAGFVNSQIKHVTGHNNEKSLEAYDSGDEDELFGLSRAISTAKSVSVTKPDHEKENHQQVGVASSTSTSFLARQKELMKKSEERNFSMGLQDSMFQGWGSGLGPSVLEQSKRKNVYVFNNCSDVTVNTKHYRLRRLRLKQIVV